MAGLGGALADGVEVIEVGGLKIEIGHSLPFCRFMYYGLYEEHLVNWVRRNIRAGDAIIEPGTNIGYIASHLLAAVGSAGTLICLEPSRRCFDTLVRNNPTVGRGSLQLLNAALSHTEGTDTFCETPRIVSAGYGFLDSAAQPPDVGSHYPVQTHSVDGLMDRFQLDRLRLLKLDIEGSELNALRGAARTLRSRKIDAIMVETNYDPQSPVEAARNSAIWPILFDAGFFPHRITRAGRLVPIQIPPRSTEAFRHDILWQR